MYALHRAFRCAFSFYGPLTPKQCVTDGLLPIGQVAITLFKGVVMLRFISSRMVMLALAAGVMWSCDGERATQPQPSGKVAADGSVVVVTVQQDGAPVSGVVVEFSRSIAGVAASYEWSATTDENGQAQLNITAGNGYYQARAVQDGSEVGHWSSIPLNAGAEVTLALPIGERAQIIDASALMMDGGADTRTRAYLMKAIERYEREGLEATVAYYNSEEGQREGSTGDFLNWRSLRIIDLDTGEILLSMEEPWQVGLNTAEIGVGDVFSQWVEAATEEGYWAEGLEFSLVSILSIQEMPEPRRNLFVRRGNVVFNSGHSMLRENISKLTQDYVNRAIEYYEREGLEATEAYYNSAASIDGAFYLFLMDENDSYLVHPILPHLIGTDIKDVVGEDGQELGKEIAGATEAGIWVQYRWRSPVSELLEDKYTWAIRHDGLIFASGYYAGTSETGHQPWLGVEPQDYTVTYVENAIARYDREGLDAMATYYNSVASFEDQWYLFVIGADDIYTVHPIFPHFIGAQDIKDVVDSSGHEFGKEIAEATEEGHWVEYLWPHPRTLAESPKVSYAVRHDGLIFASGYYPQVENPDAYTQAYAQRAIEMYDREGIEAVIDYYSSPRSIDQQWYLMVTEESGDVLVSALSPHLVGHNLLTLDILDTAENTPFREGLPNTTEDGQWLEFYLQVKLRVWVIRHDGYIFSTNYLPNQ